MSNTIEVFISYSKQDKELRDGLLSHLRPLEGAGIITWHDRQILPGTRWDEQIKARLNAANIILLLISSDFLATDYCTQVEIPEALRRHKAGEATVMPVILRACAWKFTPLEAIQAYPEEAKPVVSWTYIDDAYTDVVNSVHLAATNIKERRSQQQAERERIQREQRRQAEEQERLRQAEQLRQQQEAAKKQQLAPQQNQSLGAIKGNYIQLEALLKAGKWKEADQETARQMCQVMGRQTEGWLRVEDIEQFPCADLRAIDQLWVEHSNGKFGFSVQKKIWQQCGSPTAYNKKWENFGEAVGWRSRGLMGIGAEWKSNSELTFDTSAPEGHFPVTTIHHQLANRLGRYYDCLVEIRVEVRVVLFSRAKMCKL
jgi:hypothetical protein